LLYNAGAATTKYIITRKPEFDALKLEPKDWQGRVQEVGTIMDVSDIDLTPFRAKGGKIVLVRARSTTSQVVVDDCGRPINPMICEGQIQGRSILISPVSGSSSTSHT
jgi:hypothetical protein